MSNKTESVVLFQRMPKERSLPCLFKGNDKLSWSATTLGSFDAHLCRVRPYWLDVYKRQERKLADKFCVHRKNIKKRKVFVTYSWKIFSYNSRLVKCFVIMWLPCLRPWPRSVAPVRKKIIPSERLKERQTDRYIDSPIDRHHAGSLKTVHRTSFRNLHLFLLKNLFTSGYLFYSAIIKLNYCLFMWVM